ncbi:hypothetical protein ABZ934_31810 [Streptomyces sp. NPDC046557]
MSIAVEGWPHGFQVALMVVELTLSPVYFWPAETDEKATRPRRPARA